MSGKFHSQIYFSAVFNFKVNVVKTSHVIVCSWRTANSKIMEDQSEVKADPSPVIEDENLKKAAKKGVSITISLVMLGFSGWKDLEPGLFVTKINPLL